MVAPNVPGLINIVTITNFNLLEGPHPSEFRQIMMKNNKWALCVFFSGGVVTHCNLLTGNRNCQICVAPISLTWSRTLASLGKMVGLKHVAIATYMNGILYSMKMKMDPNNKEVLVAEENSILVDLWVKQFVQYREGLWSGMLMVCIVV